jgi:hypothetical protein
MSDPILGFILIVSFFASVGAAAYFKNLDNEFVRDIRIPTFAGAAAGLLIRFATFAPSFLVTGIVMTIVALYVRLTGRESEPADGMTLGAITGAAAAIPLVLMTDDALRRFAECVLAGAVTGYGITFGLTHVRDKGRQAGIDTLTAIAAVAAAWAPTFVLRMPRVTERHVAIGTAALIPLIVIATVFKQWPAIRAELLDESKLGFIQVEDVRTTAHPILRLGRAGWHDAGAHREFVRIASEIALRKRRQRDRPEDVARLYQLEVIKLRMELAEMAAIDRRMRSGAVVEQ